MASGEINKALASPGMNQMMASDIRGTRVYGANNENVGDINDILLDQQGEVVALVVGVGGFLGIGQKDVAIPFKAFEFVTEGQTSSTRTSSTTTSSSTATSSASNASSRGANDGTASRSASAPSSASSPSASGASGSSTGPSTTGSTPSVTTTTSTSQGVLKPERIVLRGMTKADLEAAPEFNKRGASSSSRSGETRTPASSSSGGSNR